MEENVCIGKITKPHGLRGELKVFPLTGDIRRFELLDNAIIGGKKYEITGVKYQSKFVILKFADIDSFEQAEKLRNLYVEISSAETYQLKKGEYFYYQLEGLKVESVSGEPLGILTEILEMPANDVYVVRAENGKEILLPAVDDVVKEIDIDNRIMRIELLDGLI